MRSSPCRKPRCPLRDLRAELPTLRTQLVVPPVAASRCTDWSRRWPGPEDAMLITAKRHPTSGDDGQCLNRRFKASRNSAACPVTNTVSNALISFPTVPAAEYVRSR